VWPRVALGFCGVTGVPVVYRLINRQGLLLRQIGASYARPKRKEKLNWPRTMAQVDHSNGSSWMIVRLRKLKGNNSATYSKQMKLRLQQSLRHSEKEQALER
jgi:hypothetical protein